MVQTEMGLQRFHPFSQQFLQSVADSLRLSLPRQGHGNGIGQVERAEIEDQIVRIQLSRDALIQATWRHTTQAYALDMLVNALLFAGALG